MTNLNPAIRRPARRVILIGVALAGLGIAVLRMMPASAADAVELPYNPPVGSHWIAANPLGGALKSNTTFELTEADAATGKRVFVRTTAYDDASLKEMTQTVSRKLLAASGDPTKAEQIDKLMKSMVLSLDERATYEVEDGMTRKVSEKSVTRASAMGHALSKTETRTVTVTRAP